jgi:hypothetical protein
MIAIFHISLFTEEDCYPVSLAVSFKGDRRKEDTTAQPIPTPWWDRGMLRRCVLFSRYRLNVGFIRMVLRSLVIQRVESYLLPLPFFHLQVKGKREGTRWKSEQ